MTATGPGIAFCRPDIVLEGKTYRELMELRVRYGLHKEFAGDPEGFIEDRVRRFERGRGLHDLSG